MAKPLSYRRRHGMSRHALPRAFTIAAVSAPMLLAPTAAQAADGDHLRTITADRAGTACASVAPGAGHNGVGVGIAFDGANLLVSCHTDGTVTAVLPSDGSQVAIHRITGASSIGALAWDNGRRVLWGCGGTDTVGTIDLATDVFTPKFVTSGCFDGLGYDGSDDTLWSSGDMSSFVAHHTAAGFPLSNTYVGEKLGDCRGNSGIAVGGPNLYLATGGCSQIYRLPKSLASSALFASFPARLADLECDDLTFASSGNGAIWSVNAYDNVLNAWEIPAADCRFGGAASSLTLSPATADNEVGTTHAVAATLTGPGGAAVGGASIHFDVTGGNPTMGDDVTDANGTATFGWTGGRAGSDIVVACHDKDSDRLCEDGEPTARATTTWVVANHAPQANAGGPYHTDEGLTTALAGSATDADGDALTYQWVYSPRPPTAAGAACEFANAAAPTTKITCADDGVYDLTLSAADPSGASASASTAVTVRNVAPAITGITVPLDPVAVGTPVIAEATFGDPGGNDTHAATWTWDDGTTSAGGVSDYSVGPDLHVYTAAGVYRVCLLVRDDDAGEDSACVESYVVVYDPSAGFVTGGGWIDSPAGAYGADAALTGKANFGFVSKYKDGQSVPEGSTQFGFHSGVLDFRSDSYHWLVVTGAKAIYKGSGSVNGESGYGFLVSAVDGQRPGGGGVDKFHIKIWKSSTGAVVYDNQITAPDDATTTTLGGGSIVIHG